MGVFKSSTDKNIYSCYSGTQEAADCIQPTNVKNLSVLPASMDLVGVEVELISQDNREKRLKSVLRPVRDSFEYVFIDCPPSLGDADAQQSHCGGFGFDSSAM